MVLLRKSIKDGTPKSSLKFTFLESLTSENMCFTSVSQGRNVRSVNEHEN